MTFVDMLRIEVATLQAAYPDREDEIARAHALIRNGQVVSMEDGNARVLSSTDATVWYDVNGTCSCPDAHYRKVHCKHLSAWKMFQHIQRQLDAQSLVAAPAKADAPATPPAAAVPEAPVPSLGEAPASVNCHILLEGRQVQLTLRDTDETRLLARLAAVLRQYPQPEPSLPAPSTAQGWCALHNTAMRLNKGKEGKRDWYSHKTADGSWCKGKGGSR